MFSLPQFPRCFRHPHQAEPQPCGALTPAEHFPQHCSSSATHKSPAPRKSEDYVKMELLEAKNWLSMVPQWKKALKGGSEDSRQCLL